MNGTLKVSASIIRQYNPNGREERETLVCFLCKNASRKKTAEKLEMLHVEHFLPIQEVVRQWSDRKKKIKQVVIPMLIFICTDEKGRIELLQNFHR